MTSNPKKHIIDSVLREIYGELSPSDQTDEILRRLEAGDSSLKSDSRLPASLSEKKSESGSFTAVQRKSAGSARGHSFARSANWMVVAAVLFFCVGLVAVMARLFMQPDNPNQIAKSDESVSAKKAPDSLKHEKSLKVNELPTRKSRDSGQIKTSPATDVAEKPNSKSKTQLEVLDVKPFSSNPLPTFAAQVKRRQLLELQPIVDQSLVENWRVNVIEAPLSMKGSAWLEQVFEKLIGRKPDPSEIAEYQQYIVADAVPSIENQLGIVDGILANETLAREFANRWADRFLTYLVRYVPARTRDNFDSRSETRALRGYLRQAFFQQVPLHEMAEELLNSNGSVDPNAPEFNGAAGFVALTGNNPGTLAENISRSFLGTEITCARCHSDAVYEQSRADYLGLAAFLQGTKVNREKSGSVVILDNPTNRRVSGLFFNRKNGSVVYAAPLIAGHDAELDQKSARQSLAEQLVRSDRFAKTMVNWVWSEIYGYGLARDGRIGQIYNAPHQFLLAELAEQLVAHKFDFRTAVKWTLLSRAFSSAQDPSAETLAKDIPKYGGVAFFSYRYQQLEYDPAESVNRLAAAYRQPEGLTTAGRMSLNIKQTKKGIEIIDRMEQGVLPDGLRVDDEIPEFAKGWGVESARKSALDRIADSKSLELTGKINHLYQLALFRAPTKAETNKALSLFKADPGIEGSFSIRRAEKEILQDLWWAICPR